MWICTSQWLYTWYSFILFPSNHSFEKDPFNYSFEKNLHYFNDNHSFKKKTHYFNDNHSFEKNPHYFNEAELGTINFIHILKNINWRLVCIFDFILFCHGLGCMPILGCYGLGIMHKHAMAFGCMPTLGCHGLGSVHGRMPWLLAVCPCWIAMA